MSDLISRQAVIDELEKWDWQDLYLPIHFKQILDDVPSVENKGEWIRKRTWEHDGELYCSKCGFAPYDEQDCDNFCPYCGADMRGEK